MYNLNFRGMEKFQENLVRNAVATASNEQEENIYALALGAFRMLTPNQQKAFEIAFYAYQRKWYVSIGTRTEKSVSKETKASGVPFVIKHARTITHFDNYVSLVQKNNPEFVPENRTWGVRINDVCVYHRGQLYLSMKPTYSNKARYFVPTESGLLEIDYATEQSYLCPSSRDDYKAEKTAQRQGVSRENIVKTCDIKIENVVDIKCGATQEVNEIVLAI